MNIKDFTDACLQETDGNNDNRIVNKCIQLQTKREAYQLIPLNDKQYYPFYKNSALIAEDYQLIIGLLNAKNLLYSNRAKLYTTLHNLCGETSRYFDDYKGAFAFPFLIQKKGDHEFGYTLNLTSVRSSIEFQIRKIVLETETIQTNIIHAPFPCFDREEIRHVCLSFISMLTQYFETIKDAPKHPFYKIIPSELTMFGNLTGDYFDVTYDSEEKLRANIQHAQTVLQTKISSE